MKPVLSYWQLDATSLVIVILVSLLFLLSRGWKKKMARILFSIVILLLVVCFFSPLSILSEYYLFSAHMTVHVLLLLLAGPLLLLSICSDSTELLPSFFHFFARHPLGCWLIGVGMMWWWHVPVVFNHAMQMHAVASSINWLSLTESSSLLLAGMLFSLPILSPQKEERLPALSGVVYLFTACIGCSVLGLLITFAPTALYHHYLAMHDVYRLNPVITSRWQITQSMDQQIAGLIMWVPCCFVYVIACMYLLMKWFGEKETISPVSVHQV